jgi:glutamate-5-semialdehyde dehydrogenase
MYIDIKIINEVLLEVAKQLEAEKEAIFLVNKNDLNLYTGNDLTITERLKISDNKLQGMVKGLNDLEKLPNPCGNILYSFTNEDGLEIRNESSPFGAILIIYESRPDVTIEAAAIAFKSGSKIFLKGGKESHGSNIFLVGLWHKALQKYNLPTNLITYLPLNRQETQDYLKQNAKNIDLVVPRGGDALIQFVKENATMPVLISGRGNNFIYIDSEVDNEIILPIILNSKLQNLSACNALDKLLVHTKWIKNNAELWQHILDKLIQEDVIILEHKDGENDAILHEEFLNKKLLFKIVNDVEAAILIINTYSGKHSTSILSNMESNISQFETEVDCAAVYTNASTRFTDGGQFGLGAELAISTDKLHHRGPLGLQHLVTNKWIIKGKGHTRK